MKIRRVYMVDGGEEGFDGKQPASRNPSLPLSSNVKTETRPNRLHVLNKKIGKVRYDG
jgi:hypothetical protein